MQRVNKQVESNTSAIAAAVWACGWLHMARPDAGRLLRYERLAGWLAGWWLLSRARAVQRAY